MSPDGYALRHGCQMASEISRISTWSEMMDDKQRQIERKRTGSNPISRKLESRFHYLCFELFWTSLALSSLNYLFLLLKRKSLLKEERSEESLSLNKRGLRLFDYIEPRRISLSERYLQSTQSQNNNPDQNSVSKSMTCRT